MALVGLAACGGGAGGDAATAGKSAGDPPGPEQTALLLQKAAAINSETLAAAAAPLANLPAGESIAPSALTKASSRVPVYRFFNTQTTAHFYTISETEKASVLATLPVFHYEGVAFYVSPSAGAGLSPVYRFFNVLTGVHFYSISAEEKTYIESNLPQFHFEGVAYYASKAAGGGLIPLYRFYQNQKGFHFYTASQTESDKIQATLQQYTFENVGYYVYPSAIQNFAVGGSLSGLAVGQTVVLQNNAGNDLGLSANGGFVFAQPVARDGAYSVSVKTQPVGQTCSVAAGNGVVSADVTSVVVTCANLSYAVGGSVSGLGAGKTVVLQNNGGGDISVAANGVFTFVAPVAHGGDYSVSIKTQPVGQSCTVSNGFGTATAAVGDVQVVCVVSQYTVGGAVSGLAAGQSVRLRLNTTALTVTANGAYAFPNTLVYGGTYAVTVITQPVGQSCSVSNASGTMVGSVGNVQVVCSTFQYAIGGAVSGLAAGQTVVLQNNGGGDLSRSADGGFTFAASAPYGSAYSVTVKTQPVGQSCSVSGGSGTATATVSAVQVVCTTFQYTVGGTMSGLPAGKTVVLQNTTGRLLSVTANGAFTFVDPVPHGSTYGVSVKIQPLGLSCSVSNGSGTATAAVSNVAVSCSVNTYSVGGSISGLGSGKSVVLQNNAGNDLTRAVNGNFVFTALVPYGSPYAVSIKTQPVEQTCAVANGLGTMAGQISSVAVTCADHVSVGGGVSGLIAGNPVVLTLNGGGDTSLSANGSFTMASKTPLGAVYVVGVKTQPRGQTCTLTNATGTANAAVGNVGVQCANNALTDLVISEVGGCYYFESGCWLEVYNPTASARTLSNYRLRIGQAWVTPSVFDLPSLVVAPGSYRILAANVGLGAPSTALNPVAMVGNSSGTPYWSSSGLVELVSVASNSTVDAVKFGDNPYTPEPLTAGSWTGPGAATNFILDVTDQSRSLVRPLATVASRDTDSALDWVAVGYATPGGPNDVAPGAVDADNDGLPDANELAGSTYNGLDLYSMGARTGQRDIFIEVDHMNIVKAGVIPIQASMQMVKNAFALRGFALHIDVGNLFSAGFDPNQFNLGQVSSAVPYEPCLGFNSTECANNSSPNYRSVYQWKWQHFDPRRRGIFHYALFGDAPASPSWGMGELFGNDFVLTMGDVNVDLDSGWLVQMQANSFMHELGHNLGLRHGGDEETNHKPNYLSVMNYLYSNASIPPGPSFYPFLQWRTKFGSYSWNITCYPGNTHPLCNLGPNPFVIDFSDGSSLPLNESALYESANVGRGALPGVYADWDENGALTTTAVARDLNGDGVMGVLTDHNDWAALTLPFVRSYSGGLFQKSARMNAARKAAKVPERGATVPNPLFHDRGPTVITCGPSPISAKGASNKRAPSSNWLTQPAARRQ